MIINLVLFFIPKRQEIYRLYLIKKRKKLAYIRLNSKTCSFYSYGIRNIGANSNAKISISSPDIKEQCFLVMLAGAHETQCFFFIYGINSSNNTVNHTNFLDTNVVLTGSLDDKTIYIQIGPWARGFICSYNSFTVAIK